MSGITEFDCDVCGSADATEIECLKNYSGGRPIHVCKKCGFIYVRNRRSFQAIADTWSHELYGQDGTYTAQIPAIKARQIFVAHTIDSQLSLKGKKVCDIGAGEGCFLAILAAADLGAKVFGIEPSPALCLKITEMGFKNFPGTIETYLQASGTTRGEFDVVSILWTLEGCQDCKVMLEAAHHLLKPGGHVVVATGSRILVPFKKPLNYYVSDAETDTHNFRFSANTLEHLMSACSFKKQHVNRYIDHDVLCMIAEKHEKPSSGNHPKDDWQNVISFFERWDAETRTYYLDQ